MKALILVLLVARADAQQPTASAPPSQQSTAVTAAIGENAACLKCHEPILALLKKAVVHTAVEMGCATCHIDHQAAGTKSETAHYLISPQPNVCAACHDTKDKALAASHRGQPFERAACTGCHNPHGSDSPKLIATRQHPPFTARQCERCHQHPEDGKVRFTANSVNELCEGCHTKFKARFDKSKVKHTILEIGENSCVSCHLPHASEQPGLLKARVNAVCTECHTDKPGTKKFVHPPASAACTICHDPHSSDYPVHLKADINTLCTVCHGLRPPTQNSEGERLIVPDRFPPMATKIALDSQNRGHPNFGHPVSGTGIGPSKDKPLSCVSCHNPHSGDVVQRFIGDLRGTALCLRCHGNQ